MPITTDQNGELSIDPDPEEVLGRYKSMLSDSQHRVLVLETAVSELLRETKSLNAQVEALMGGNQAVPTGGDSPAG